MIADAVNWWPMNEGSGTTIADVAGGFGATTNALWIPGKIGSGLSFDGTTQFASYPSISLGSTHSIGFWVRWKSTQDGVLIGGGGGTYAPYIDGASAGSSIYYSAGTGNFVSWVHGGLDAVLWNHFVITRAAGTMICYKNGSKLGSTLTLGSSATTVAYTRFGQYDSGTLFWAPADLDDVRFYTRALTAGDAAELYVYGTQRAQQRRKRLTVPHRSRRGGYAR